jgi:HAD superfamily hydrolase (TIGR01549 family)
MGNKRLVSFDLDNTLIDPTYTTLVWEIGMPQRYAKRYNTDLSEATSIVKAEYEKAGDSSLEWYAISYWFEYFNLPGRWQDLMEKHRDKIRPFPEVIEVLKDLAQDHELIIISNAAREFVEIEIEGASISKYFSRIFSTTSDFHQVKKTSHLYKQICGILGVKASATIHVGDHYEYDYVVPRSLGIEAYYLDREGKKPKDDFTIRDLREFANLIEIAKAPIETD